LIIFLLLLVDFIGDFFALLWIVGIGNSICLLGNFIVLSSGGVSIVIAANMLISVPAAAIKLLLNCLDFFHVLLPQLGNLLTVKNVLLVKNFLQPLDLRL
jgi:hypothetical protein